jgi:hypothetical protein
MPRQPRVILRAAALTLAFVPCVALADALPPDPQDIYYHCTPAEQCPQGETTCATIRGPAGHTSPDEACAKRAEGAGLEQRCAGSGGYLYCPKGATGSWKTDSAARPSAPGTARRRGCS